MWHCDCRAGTPSVSGLFVYLLASHSVPHTMLQMWERPPWAPQAQRPRGRSRGAAEQWVLGVSRAQVLREPACVAPAFGNPLQTEGPILTFQPGGVEVSPDISPRYRM